MAKDTEFLRREKPIIASQSKKILQVILILTAILCVNFVWAAFSYGDLVTHWDTAGSGNGGSMGITTAGNNVWVGDALNSKIQKYDTDGNYITQWALNVSNNDNIGIWTNGTQIWVTDYDEIYVYDIDGTYRTKWTLNATNTAAHGMTSNGTDIWVVDVTEEKAYRYSMTGTYISSFTTVDSSGTSGKRRGIAVYGKHLYLVDGDPTGTTDIIYEHYHNGTYINNFTATADNDDSYGLEANGDSIWSVDESEAEVYKYFKEEPTGMVVTLVSPANDTSLSTNGTVFTASYNATNYALKNATYHIWFSKTGVLFNQTTYPINISNVTKQYFNNFTLDTYIWNVKACGENATATLCEWADNNYTFFVGASVDAESYNNMTYETSNEKFYANISLLPEANLYFVEFYYNGTSYSATKTSLGSNQYHLYTNIDIPIIVSSPQNLTFFWRLTYEKADNSFEFQNLTYDEQTVYQIQLEDCSSSLTTVSLNFTSWNEKELTRINGFNFKATFFYWLGNGESMKNVSFDNPNIYNKSICINPDNVTYYLINSDIKYEANFTGYVERDYYFENHTINNVIQNVHLYLLNSTDSTSFILKVIDQNQQDVENALIHTQRYYPELGKYKTVQIAKTDKNGKSIGFFKTETVDYRFVIKKDSITELITSKQKVIPEETPYTLLFTIGEALTKPWADFDDLDNLDYILVFNDTTNITSFTYIDTSEIFTQGRLLVQEVKFNQTNIVICNTTSTESSATLTCDLNGYSGTFLAQGFIKRDGSEKTISIIYAIITTAVEILGMLGLMLGWFIILVAGCAFFWHPIAGVVGIEASIILVNLIGLVSFSPLFIFGSLAVAIILIFILKD